MRYCRLLAVVVALSVLGLNMGCTGVEKQSKVHEGTAVGAGVGTLIGAGAGHASALGGGPGALVGLALGATTGMLTTSRYYDDPDEAAMDPDQLREMRELVEAREREREELEAKLRESEEQRQALLEAHRQMQEDERQLQRDFGEDVQLTASGDGYKATVLGDVLFASGSADLSSEGRSVLGRAARKIKEHFPNAYIEVQGHTDNVPITHSHWDSNMQLSTARAVSVLHFLRDEHGFSERRMRATGYSDTKPVASNETADGRRQNRRAEIVIIPEGSDAARELER